MTPGAPTIDGVSKATLFGVGWSPRWKGSASLAWKRGQWSSNLTGRFIGRYLDYQDFAPNNNELGNTWIFDAGVQYKAGEALAQSSRWLSHSYVSLVAVNVLNKVPPYSNNFAWYDFAENDLRGRYVRLSVGTRF